MRVLALDSTTRTGSVALVEDDRIVEERQGDAARTHAERLPMELIALAEAHRVALADVDLYAVASGPGSFTGLRIGIATVQGLAFVQGRRIFSVATLEALGHAAAATLAPETVVAVWMDAHRRDVFAAAYRVTAAAPHSAGRLAELDGPSVGAPVSILARWAGQLPAPPALFVGDGAGMFASEIERARPGARIEPPPLLAGTIGRLAVARAAEAVHPAAIRPLYVRRPDAEIARDARS
ncbi:MAG TPA: tRNA (adenosine(37)-N6)-threonylcarbamoyltransferase complex dimerization subunit type 1 TsaB [Vicinamibacterales bacterium]|nr:tRNA (adenosine(37)-N6)-threonylcarbamoyltransferase complex dimerization subunit type 1 TsaB [Vicinamibacterales bacterium]